MRIAAAWIRLNADHYRLIDLFAGLLWAISLLWFKCVLCREGGSPSLLISIQLGGEGGGRNTGTTTFQLVDFMDFSTKV